MNFIGRNGQITDAFGNCQGMMNMHCQFILVLFAVWHQQYLLLVKIFLKGKTPGGLIYINQLGPVNSWEDFVFSLFKCVRRRPLGSYFIPWRNIEYAYSLFIQIVSQFKAQNVWHACNWVIRNGASAVFAVFELKMQMCLMNL